MQISLTERTDWRARIRQHLCGRHTLALILIAASLIIQWGIVGRYAWWNVPASTPPILLLLLPVLVALLTIGVKTKRYLFLYAFLLLLLWFPKTDLNLAAPLHAMKTAPETGISVMSWNTYLWDEYDTEEMYELLQSKQQDLYILNEHFYKDEENRDVYLTERQQQFEEALPDYEVLTDDQFVILSKYPVIARELAPSRQAMLVKLQVGERELVILNVHLVPHLDLSHSPLSGDFWEANQELYELRQQGFSEIRGMMSMLDPDDGLIVTGTMNTTALMHDLDQEIGSLHDASAKSSSLYPATWKMQGLGYWWQVDHFLHNDKLNVLHYELEEHAGFSDHKAMLVRVDW